MSRFESQRQESVKRRWQQRSTIMAPNMNTNSTRLVSENPNRLQAIAFPGLVEDDDDLISAVVPPVTVVLEGRSICQRISLHKHASYRSLAKALRQMLVEGGDAAAAVNNSEHDIDLSNAVPGHLIAYEDIENDLLLAGDLNWNDFVRVAKRIRILPVKGNSRKEPTRGA